MKAKSQIMKEPASSRRKEEEKKKTCFSSDLLAAHTSRKLGPESRPAAPQSKICYFLLMNEKVSILNQKVALHDSNQTWAYAPNIISKKRYNTKVPVVK